MKNHIDGVVVKTLNKIPDERGCIYHMLRCDDALFEKFGEIYFSSVRPKVVKGWHWHKKMTLNYTVIVGTIKLVLYDAREKSPTQGDVMEIITGEDNYCLIKVPPQIWNGFQCVSAHTAIVANAATLPYDPDEIVRIDPYSENIPYSWT